MSKSKPPAKVAGAIIVTLASSIAILALYQASSLPGAGPPFFSWAYWQVSDNGTSRSEVLRNLGLLAAALVGLGFGIWRAVTAYWQARASQSQANTANELARIAEQGQFTERFTKAVEQLGNEQLSLRLGGIYGLWRLAEDSPARDMVSVFDILCAFVRNPTYAPEHEAEPKDFAANTDAGTTGKEHTHKIAGRRPDVQAVLNLIGAPEADYRQHLPNGYWLDLSGADLRDADLGVANLNIVNLRYADLRGANLSTANLAGARLWHANLAETNLISAELMHANFMGANLQDADLGIANLTDAILPNATLSGAQLRSAILQGATLFCAKLDGANLADADLTGADLTGADLTGADIDGADLDGADVEDANFAGVDISGANLTNAMGLTQSQIDQTKYNPADPPMLPPGLTLPPQPDEAEDKDSPPAV